jgi:hypothetical protein
MRLEDCTLVCFILTFQPREGMYQLSVVSGQLTAKSILLRYRQVFWFS